MEPIDFAKTFKDLYTATGRIQEVNAAAGTFFAVDGQGPPGGEAFQKAIECLYGTTYTAKFMLKHEGVVDFKVGRLECIYLSDCCQTAKDQWQWRLMLRVPETITAKHLAQARKILQEKKGLGAAAVRRIRWKEGLAVQVLHVGPYDQIGTTYGQLDSYAGRNGLVAQCPAHEIYISDPRRVAAEKLKTIARLPVKKASKV